KEGPGGVRGRPGARDPGGGRLPPLVALSGPLRSGDQDESGRARRSPPGVGARRQWIELALPLALYGRGRSWTPLRDHAADLLALRSVAEGDGLADRRLHRGRGHARASGREDDR